MCVSTQKVYLKSQRTPAPINCFVILKQKRWLAYRLPPVHADELTFKMNLHFWILTTMSDVHNNLIDSWRSFPYLRPKGMCLNPSDIADKQDSSDGEEPLWSRCRPVTLFGPLSHVTVCDAMVTATVKGGACDLCLTNGSFIIPRATSMSPVFIALYFKLNPQQCPSIMVAHDLYWRWWLGPGEGSVQVLSSLPHQKRQFLWTMAAISDISNVKRSLIFAESQLLWLCFVHNQIRWS